MSSLEYSNKWMIEQSPCTHFEGSGMFFKHVGEDGVPGELVCLEIEPLTSERVRTLRATYGLSQSEFAKKFGIPLAKLKEWEGEDD